MESSSQVEVEVTARRFFPCYSLWSMTAGYHERRRLHGRSVRKNSKKNAPFVIPCRCHTLGATPSSCYLGIVGLGRGPSAVHARDTPVLRSIGLIQPRLGTCSPWLSN